MAKSKEERMEILQMLSQGKIAADKAADLLGESGQSEASLKTGSNESVYPPQVASTTVKSVNDDLPNWLHVRVSDLNTGKSKVTVNIPLRLLRFGLNLGNRFVPELDNIEWNDLEGLISSEKGMLIDVEDEEDGEHVQIYID